MKPLICFIGILFPIFSLNAQIVYEKFDQSGDAIPSIWTGDTTSFVVNEEGRLQLMDTSENILPKYLSTNFLPTGLLDKEWNFEVKLDFSPSSSNKLRFYLASSSPSLAPQPEDTGPFEAYYLEIGETGTSDGISLFYANNSTTKLLGKGGIGLFSQPFETTIKVIVDTSSNFYVYYLNDTRNSFELLVSTMHDMKLESTHLGLQCYFTASRSKLFYFDNIYFGPVIQDTISPTIASFSVVDEQSIQLIFSEPMDFSKLDFSQSFTLNPGSQKPESIATYADSLTIHFSDPFTSGINYQLSITDLVDSNGNLLSDQLIEFVYIDAQAPEEGDLVFTEILADPSPVVGLPENEFVELYNTTDKFLDLTDLQFTDNSSTVGSLAALTLAPSEYLVLCPSNALLDFTSFGKAVSPDKWPSLNNGFDSLKLLNSSGELISSIAYDRSWYVDPDKMDGGYSLELVNPALNCFDVENWQASRSPQGGTPATVNSVYDSSFYGSDPRIVGYELVNNNTFRLTFDKEIQENLDELIEVSINNELNAGSYQVEGRQLTIDLTVILTNDRSYNLQISNLSNCHAKVSAPIHFSFYYDIEPPQLESAYVLNDSLILLSFDEAINYEFKEARPTFYFQEDSSVLESLPFTPQQVLLKSTNPLQLNHTYKLCISGVADSIGNLLADTCLSIQYRSQGELPSNSLIITELMVKPIEGNKLPFAEYVEIYNPKNDTISLVGLFIADRKDTSKLPIQYLGPKEYLILCPLSKQEEFKVYGKTLGVSPWPSLNNSGDSIGLLGTNAAIIYEVAYDASWYKDFMKEEDGGWSLEMIDPNNPCAGKPNWRSSIAVWQGSPGQKNSVNEAFVDTIGPELLSATAVDSAHILLKFSETIIGKFNPNDFEMFPLIQVVEVIQINKKQLLLTLASPLTLKLKYEIQLNHIFDCVGNPLQKSAPTHVILPEEAVVGDLIINEILFDPLSGGVDFIELYNRSDKYLELSACFLANGEDSISLDFVQQIIAPYSFQVLTESPEILAAQYPTSVNQEALIAHTLPALPNGEGQLYLYSASGQLFDQLIYDDKMHSSLLHNTEGVSLERIHPEAPSLNRESWISAASSVGYATPGLKNSQLSLGIEASAIVEVSPASFSPNTPGRNYTLIKYSLSSQAAVATVKVFNTKGQEVKTIANNASIGTEGFFRWDGDSASGIKVGVGYYIIYFSYFNLDGEAKVIKKLVAISAG